MGARPSLLIAGGVHATCVLVADLLLVGRAIGIGLGGVFENLFQMQAIEFKELGEAAVRGLVGRQRIALEPAVATEAIEVFAGVDGLVDQRGIEDAQLMCGLCAIQCCVLAESGCGGKERKEQGRMEGVQRLSDDMAKL